MLETFSTENFQWFLLSGLIFWANRKEIIQRAINQLNM